MMRDFIQQRKDWIEDNPLRKWRKENKLTVNVTASMFNVGGYSVQRWESGDVKPNDENMDKMKRAIGNDAEVLWDEWLSKRPSI